MANSTSRTKSPPRVAEPPKASQAARPATAAREQRRNQRPDTSTRGTPYTQLFGRPGSRLGSWFSGGGGLSRADQERAKERLAVLLLSSILVLAVLLVGGALVWDKIVTPLQPVARLDGRPISLRQYTDVLAYRQNVLQAQLQQVQAIAMQPTPAAGSGSTDNVLQQLAQQQLSQIQNQLFSLSSQLVDDLIDDELVRAEAARRNITATPAEIEAELKQIIGYEQAAPTPVATPAGGAADGAAEPTAVPTATPRPSARQTQSFESAYREYRRFTAGTDAVIRSDVEMQILRRKLGDALAETVPARTEQVHARHILVADEAAAASVLERLNNGESFEALAAELSTDTGSKSDGGDLGWFPRGVMISEFEEAAFNLQPGQTSAPVKTSFGVHIIRVDERQADREVDPQLLESLRANALPRWLEAEKKNHQVEYLLTPEMQEWASRNGRRPSLPA
jgi:parvulin-like peptidyl-prolyl isomerase